MSNVTYDTANKIIILDQVAPVDSVVSFDARQDLYSDAKHQWLDDLSLNKFEFPWEAIGGNALPGGAVAPRIYFLKAPWQIRPYEEDHTVNIAKNLFTDDGRSLSVPTLGEYTVTVNVSSDFSSGDDRIERLLDLLEADEELINGTARKLHRLTKAVLLQKAISGGNLTNVTISE